MNISIVNPKEALKLNKTYELTLRTTIPGNFFGEEQDRESIVTIRGVVQALGKGTVTFKITTIRDAHGTTAPSAPNKPVPSEQLSLLQNHYRDLIEIRYQDVMTIDGWFAEVPDPLWVQIVRSFSWFER